MENNNQQQEQNVITEEVIPTTDWLKLEAEQLKQDAPVGDFPDALHLDENKPTKITVDISEPWKRFEDKVNDCVKKIIPVTLSNGEKRVWWLNTKNPVYREIVTEAAEGKTNFNVLRTGNLRNTKYQLLKD